MSADFTVALKKEIASLEAELGADIRYRRLTELRNVLSLYDIENVARSGVVGGEEGTKVAKQASGRRPSPEREKALDGARLYLNNRLGPTPTRDILAHLEAMEIEIGGENPVNNLSAMLSNSGMFIPHGRSGWTVAPKEFADVVASVFQELSMDTAMAVAEGWERKEGIPPEIDSMLLVRAREAIGRDLLDGEKIYLRDLLAKSAHIFS